MLARNAFYLLLGQIVSTTLAIVLNAALGRTLGPADFGVYFLLISMSAAAYVLVDWGQSVVLIRETARRLDLAGPLLGSVLAFRVVAVSSVVVLTACFARLFGYELRIQLLAALAIACAFPLALSQPYGCVFRARNRMDLDAHITVWSKVMTVVATLAALAFGGRLVSVFLAQLVGGGGALALAVFLWRRLALQTPRPSWAVVRELWDQGTPIAFFTIAIAAQPYIDAIVLSKLTPAAVVGYYGAARNILGVLITPATILSIAAFPQMSHAAFHPIELHRIFRMALRPTLLLGALAAVGCYLFGNFAVDLIYGASHFRPSVEVLEFYAPVFFILFFNMLLGNVVFAIRRTREMAFAKLGNILVSTILALFLVPAFQARWDNGGLGIVVATGAGELLMLIFFAAVLPPGTLDKRTLLDAARALLASFGTLALFWLLPPFSPWLGIPLCIIVFGLLALSVGLVSRAELTVFSDFFNESER
ncbi:MAG: oligosaccharide flippase family protein [Bradyrhizobium sp.]|nr:oligosaccharide flippase family protein [Bradyrhizobium sp.]